MTCTACGRDAETTLRLDGIVRMETRRTRRFPRGRYPICRACRKRHERHGDFILRSRSKLTPERIRLLRARVKEGVPIYELARRIGEPYTTVYTWAQRLRLTTRS